MIQLVIVDDEQLIASSMATLLSLEEDLDVLRTFPSGEAVLEWWRKQVTIGETVPDVLVTDLNLGGIDGIEVAQQIGALSPKSALVIVTSHSRPLLLKKALATGVQGFCRRQHQPRNSPQPCARCMAAGGISIRSWLR